jgi:uncharacterized protein
MKINLKSLILSPNTSKQFHLAEPGNPELLEDIGGSFLQPVTVDLTVEKIRRAFTGSGTVNTVIQLICSRCLEEIIFPIKTNFYVTIDQGVLENQSHTEDDFLVIAANGDVDLSGPVEEAIFLSIPLNPLCRDDCEGICAVCGVNKNLEK